MLFEVIDAIAQPREFLPELLHQLLELIGHLGDAVEAGVRQSASPIAGHRLAAFIGALGVDGDAALADIGVLGDAGDLLLAGVSAHSRHAEVGGVALQRRRSGSFRMGRVLIQTPGSVAHTASGPPL